MTITWTRPGASGRVGALVEPLGLTAAAAAATDPAAEEQWRKVGDLISRFYGYLRDNIEDHPGLAPAIQPLSTAVADYRSRSAADPYASVRAVLSVVQQQCRLDPSIPQP